MDPLPKPAPLPWNLALAQASEISGIPRRLLIRAIRDKRLAAHRWAGEYNIHHRDLVELRPSTEPLAWSGAATDEGEG